MHAFQHLPCYRYWVDELDTEGSSGPDMTQLRGKYEEEVFITQMEASNPLHMSRGFD